MIKFLLRVAEQLSERWSYCMGCGRRTIQVHEEKGWVCTEPDCRKVNLR